MAYTWKCTINNLGSSSPSNVSFNHEGTMPTFEEVTFNGDVFIKIPTMYGKVNTVVSNQITSFTIADGKVDDSYLPFPVFVKEDGTSIMSYVLIGKYLNNSSSTMQSVANTSSTGLTIGTARTYARNRGVGYQLYDWMFQRLWQYLIICAMNTINTNSGSGITTDALGIYWGGSEFWVDGLTQTSGVLAVSYKPTKYIDNATTSTDGYVSIGYNLANPSSSSQCVSKLGYDVNNPFVNYPSSSVTSSSYNTYYCDFYYYNSGNNYPLMSSVGASASYIGAFYTEVRNSWNRTKAVRLCYRPVDEVIITTHNINYNLNNCTGASSNPATIDEGESITLSFTANTGYSFPTDIRVLGVTSYNWNPNTGNLILNNVTGDVTIVINCSLSLFSITTNLFNCTSDSTNPNTIEYGSSVSLQFTPNQTYMFTDTISVTNATYTWNKDTGVLNISNPTNNVVITLSAIDDGKLYLYLYQNTAEGNRVDKTNYLTSVGLISGTFRDSTSINDLVITYQSELLPNFNYVYIPKLNRYYFVDDITSENYSLWTLALSVDPLMTYKEAILNCNGFVDRCESDFNANIIDKKRVVEEGNTIEVNTVTNELFTNTIGTYIMTALLISFDSIEG